MMSSKGFTLPEVLMALAILVLMGVGAHRTLLILSKGMIKTNLAVRSTMEGQKIMFALEREITHANEVTVAEKNQIQFTCDWDRTRDYDPWGDFDGDGLVNQQDADVDNDAGGGVTGWNVGYNLKDDDDDGDNKIDYQIRYTLDGNILYRDYSRNEEAWGQHLKKIGEGIKDLQFSYFGSVANNLGQFLDLGEDGDPGTFDSGEADGIISEIEIDKVGPANNGDGNGNGELDTYVERRYITSVRVFLDLDVNADGISDFDLDGEIYPPLLSLKPMAL